MNGVQAKLFNFLPNLKNLFFRIFGIGEHSNDNSAEEVQYSYAVPAFSDLSAAAAQEGRMIYNYSVIALGAKLTSIGRIISREEYLAFREMFPMPGNSSEKVRELFTTAYADKSDFRIYARQLYTLFEKSPDQLLVILDKLILIALSDRPLCDGEKKFLKDTAQIFKITEKEFESILKKHLVIEINPYKVLGVEDDIANAELKKAYREMMRKYHPDVSHNSNMSKKAIANKAAEINAAYHRILKMRGIKNK